MFRGWTRWMGMSLGCVIMGWAFAAGSSAPPEQLLPANAVLLANVDGSLPHKAGFEKTAAYAALYESGLVDVFKDKIVSFKTQVPPDVPLKEIEQAMQLIEQNGFSIAVALDPKEGDLPLPWAMIVLNNAAALEKGLIALSAKSDGEVKFSTAKVAGRNVTSTTIPDSPGIQMAFWAEQGHLVITAGIGAVEKAMAVADGKKANITKNPLWKKYHDAPVKFESISCGWLDAAPLREAYGKIPLPPTGGKKDPLTVNSIITMLGLDTLNVISSRSGYNGKSCWSETVVEAPGSRKGLLSFMDQKPITLADFPPLPGDADSFAVGSFDWSKAYSTLLTLAEEIEGMGPPQVEGQVQQGLENIEQILGFSLKEDLFDTLGGVSCLYQDPKQGFMGIGPVVVQKVKDGKTLRETFNRILTIAEQASEGKLTIHRAQKRGREIITFQAAQGGIPITPCLCIDDQWLVFGIMSQQLDSFFLRQEKKSPSWKPSAEMQAGFDELPKSFTSLSMTNPATSYKSLIGVFPLIETAIRSSGALPPNFQFPIQVSDLPPEELVTGPLFPNLSVGTASPEGVKIISRNSLQLLGGTKFLAGGPIVVALLLPAVQQARTAARRTQSKNNLKQIALALHNYHDVFGGFPQGTHPNDDLDEDERLSWLVDILPYMDQGPLYNQINFKTEWSEEPNARLLKNQVPTYLNPAETTLRDKDGYGLTHYVGIAGLGEDGPELKVNDPKAGVFAYDRKTGVRDITDGTSNTLMVGEAFKEFGAWGAGGKSTIRPFTQKAYIKGPDGIGGPYPGGCHFGMCDGAVRFVSDKIDPKTLEALTTICGGEVVEGF